MFRNVYLKSLYDARRGLIGWSSAIAALVLLEAALWPSVRDIPDLVELYTLLIPAPLLVYGIWHGARALAGEEERGTLELLLVTPVSGARVVLDKAVALATSITVLGLALFAATLLGSGIFGLGISPAGAAGGALGTTLLGVEYGVLALAAGAVTGRRSTAIAIAAVAAVAAYVVYAAGLVLPRFESWQPYSPIDQAFHNGPLGAGLHVGYLWLVAGTAALVALTLPALDGRDISTTSGR